MKHKVEEIMAMVKGGDLDVKVWKQVFNKEGSILHYSTDISAAWQVVELMVKKHNSFVLQWVAEGHCKVTFNWNPDIEVVYASAPEGICKAALLAKLKGD